MNAQNPEVTLREYFARIAASYDTEHAGDEHTIALGHIAALARKFAISSVLDVGCGTARGLQQLAEELPGLELCGADISPEMLEQARNKGIPGAKLIQCDGYRLPLPDASFDAVCEFGFLHHVRHPQRVVFEMCRVARKAVFLSDHNRFGQGSLPKRLLKLVLYKVGLWDFAFYLRTSGKGYGVSEGDGVSYSYSVFDSYPQLAKWADQILTISILGSPAYPLLTAHHVLVAASRGSRTDVEK